MINISDNASIPVRKTKLKAKSSNVPALYQLRITLIHSSPEIWRSVLVRSDTTLDRLHDIIQAVMPWTNSHMHQFIKGRDYYEPESDDDDGFFGNERKTHDEAKHTVAQLLSRVRSKFYYEYDFGDGWEHEIRLEKILPLDPAHKRPLCLDGQLACPPDDCGGIFGYYELLKTLSDKKHPDHAHMLEWIGGKWDAGHFDVAEANKTIRAWKL